MVKLNVEWKPVWTRRYWDGFYVCCNESLNCVVGFGRVKKDPLWWWHIVDVVLEGLKYDRDETWNHWHTCNAAFVKCNPSSYRLRSLLCISQPACYQLRQTNQLLLPMKCSGKVRQISTCLMIWSNSTVFLNGHFVSMHRNVFNLCWINTSVFNSWNETRHYYVMIWSHLD